jgi:hypothetical protein
MATETIEPWRKAPLDERRVPDSCAVPTTTTSGHPLSGATGAMEDHSTSIKYQVSRRRNIKLKYTLQKTK